MLPPQSQADRTEPYTNIQPFDKTNDTSVEFFFKPSTLTALVVALSVLAYVAMTNDVLEEGRDKKVLIVLGINVLYELLLVYLLFEDLSSARRFMLYFDSNLNVPLPEKSYAEDCALSVTTLWNAFDIFCVAHLLGWLGKAIILRDYWFCWILSISFELAEYSLEHQLPNFAECWWDHWVLDVLICNWLGTYLGIKICQYFEVKSYVWRGFRQSRGLKAKTGRVLKQMTPHDWTTFQWEGTSSFSHYCTVVLLLSCFLAAELNPFYLKSLLWMEPDHPIVISRLAGIFIFGIPAVRELYDFRNNPSRSVSV
ncbi:hypothetical protein FRB96_001544 [Tulasnella sp. 330]|nr:hypothetical protein FRB96_001544 [Tulasnella sp. 330]